MLKKIAALMTALCLLMAPAATAKQETRWMRFVGNSAFEFSDGVTTILFDFPYRSGAFGYMEFGPEELTKRPDSLCLFTHGHADHFSAEDLEAVGCRVAGPAQVLAKVPPDLPLEGPPPWTFGSASIVAIESEHGDVEHFSYLVTWHGVAILVTGDVESLEPILGEIPRADLILLPYWLSAETDALRERFPDAVFFLSHQEREAPPQPGDGGSRLEQGGRVSW
jgi:L-ascorbate metabolism protein UlaG (beta-lactamase superfamily)